MAKKAWLERNKKKSNTVKKFAALRAELKAKKDYVGLTKLPKNASPTRVVNRCSFSGRRRGYLRKFGCSTKIPRVRGGLGVAIVSTSAGVMTDVQARKQNLGGELLCYIW